MVFHFVISPVEAVGVCCDGDIESVTFFHSS